MVGWIKPGGRATREDTSLKTEMRKRAMAECGNECGNGIVGLGEGSVVSGWVERRKCSGGRGRAAPLKHR